MLIMINGDNKMNMKRDKRYMVQLLIQGRLFSLNMKSLFYLELENGRVMI